MIYTPQQVSQLYGIPVDQVVAYRQNNSVPPPDRTVFLIGGTSYLRVGGTYYHLSAPQLTALGSSHPSVVADNAAAPKWGDVSGTGLTWGGELPDNLATPEVFQSTTTTAVAQLTSQCATCATGNVQQAGDCAGCAPASNAGGAASSLTQTSSTPAPAVATSSSSSNPLDGLTSALQGTTHGIPNLVLAGGAAVLLALSHKKRGGRRR